jgi:hypothetical protein
MELHASSGQTIEDFAENLFQIAQIADIVGVFNDTRIRVELWNKDASELVKKYYDAREHV